MQPDSQAIDGAGTRGLIAPLAIAHIVMRREYLEPMPALGPGNREIAFRSPWVGRIGLLDPGLRFDPESEPVQSFSPSNRAR